MSDRKLKRLLLEYRDRRSSKDAARLFDLLAGEMLAVARRIARDAGEAEDLVQATFLNLLESPEKFDEQRAVRPWVMGILTREARYWHRRDARRPDPERLGFDEVGGGTPPPSKTDPAGLAGQQESKALISLALDRLPELYSTVLKAHLEDGQTADEIALKVNRSPATVRVQLHRGLAQLRELLPVGLATGLAITVMPRGLEAMRSDLIQQLSLQTGVPAISASAATSITLAGLSFAGGMWILGALAIVLVGLLTLFGPEDGAPLSARTKSDSTLGESDRVQALTRIEEPESLDGEITDDRDRREVAPVLTEQLVPEVFSPLTIDVVWADDSPAQDVTISITAPDSGAAFYKFNGLKTDERGRIHFDNLPPGRYGVFGDRGGIAAITLSEVSRDPGSAISHADWAELITTLNYVRLQIPSGVDVEGIVVDAGGLPVSEAEVWISSSLYQGLPTVAAVTKSDGSFKLRSLSKRCSLGARHPRFSQSETVWIEWLLRGSKGSAETHHVELLLPGPGAEITGIVLDPYGNPVGGAQIRLGSQDLYQSRAVSGSTAVSPPIEIVSDVDGRFMASGLTPGDVRVAVLGAGFPVWVGGAEASEFTPGFLEVRLEQGGWIEGSVRNEISGPVYGAWVRISRPRNLAGNGSASSFFPVGYHTREDGLYRIGPLRAGEVRLRATDSMNTIFVQQTVVTTSGETLVRDLVLSDGLFISGTILDVDGQPLPGWSIVVEPEGRDGPYPRATFADSEGNFHLKLNGSPGTCQLQLYAGNDYLCAPVSWFDGIATGTVGLELRVNPEQEPRGSLRLDFATESGKPMPEASLIIVHERFGRIADVRIESGQSSLLIEHLPEGLLSLRVSSKEFETLRVNDLRLEPGEARTLDSLVLRAP